MLLTEFRRSGLNATEFCTRVGISRTSLSRWQSVARRVPSAPPAVFQELPLAPASVRLAPATTRPSRPAAAAPWWVLEVVTPDGTVVRGCEATSLARLLTALGAAGC